MSPTATAADAAGFRAWCRGFAGCDGGDPGSPRRPATWVCGIEPGVARVLPVAELARVIRADATDTLATGYADWRDNLAHSFTRRIVKLLTALAGQSVADYREFARQHQPFCAGARGFCRFNLYPVALADTQPERWSEELARLSGFARKADYLAWCDTHRLPRLRALARSHRPRLIIGLGRTWLEKFRLAFLDPDSDLQEVRIAGKPIAWARNGEGTLVAVLPFLTSASGLQSNAAIAACGKHLRDLVGCP